MGMTFGGEYDRYEQFVHVRRFSGNQCIISEQDPVKGSRVTRLNSDTGEILKETKSHTTHFINFENGFIDFGDQCRLEAILPDENNYLVEVRREPTPEGEPRKWYQGGPKSKKEAFDSISKHCSEYRSGAVKISEHSQPLLKGVLKKVFSR